MKRVAVLLYPQFSLYEMSVALSVLGQGNKEIDFFGLDLGRIKSEEGVVLTPEITTNKLKIEEYDGLLLTGALDCEPLVTDDRYGEFVRQFDRPDVIIGSISSSTVLLAKTGLLKGKRYMSGIPEKYLEELGFQKEYYVKDGPPVREGRVITAKGSGFVEFGVAFGEALDLTFDPLWYGSMRHSVKEKPPW